VVDNARGREPYDAQAGRALSKVIDRTLSTPFHGDGQNGCMITNFANLVVPDEPPAPKPYNGQFIQINVLDVAPAE